MRFLFLGLLTFVFSAQAAVFNMQCDLVAPIYKAEITLTESYGFAPAPPKSDPTMDLKDGRQLVGWIKSNGPFVLTLHNLRYVSENQIRIRRVTSTLPLYSDDITTSDWKTKGFALLPYELDIQMSDQAGYPMTMRMKQVGLTYVPDHITYSWSGVSRQCSLKEDEASKSEALINTLTPMQ
jgi:hypothetical protein